MADLPDWLPPMLEISEPSEHVVDELYIIFRRDLLENQPKFDQRLIIFGAGKSVKNYEVIFWHLITGSYHAPDIRFLEVDRARRLPWCAPTINHALEGLPLVWDHEEADGKLRTYIWLKDFEYVVIVQKETITGQGDVARLITAYSTNKEWGRKKLQKKYEQRQKQ